MATQGQVTKIYELKSLGYSDLMKELDTVVKKFEQVKKAKQGTAGKILSAQDATEAKKYADELAKLTIEEQKLRVETQRLTAETKALHLVKQQENNQRKQSKQGIDAEAGSIARIREEIKQLGAAIIKVRQGSGKLVDFSGQMLNYNDALKKLKSLTTQEQDFRRQFNRDGLLVAEYSSGFNQVGKNISDSLKRAFTELRGQAFGLVTTLYSIQAVMLTTAKTFNDVVKLDSIDSALKLVSQTEEQLAINQEFLTETTEKLGLEYISATQAFKGFFAASTQAGISADETRKIFFAASAASANLKLSQEDTNGVLLAFSQIASKGKVQAEELRGQIGERVPGAFAIAARAIGVTQKELNKMLENGEVIASEFLPKFAAELQKTFGGNSNKNVEGLQANINRLKNQFTELLRDNQQGLSSFFSLLISSAGILIKLLPLVVAALALYTAEQIRAYIATQATTQGTILYNAVLIAQRAYTIAANIVLTAYYGTIALLTGGLTRATAATTIFSNVMRAMPLGAILTLLGLVAAAVTVFAKSVNNSTKALSDFALKQLALNDTTRKAADIIAEQTVELNKWYTVAIKTAQGSLAQKNAIDELIKISPKFRDAINGEVIDLDKLREAYDAVTESIKKKAFASASADLASAAQKEVNKVAAVEIILGTEFASGKGFNRQVKGLTEEQIDILFNGLDLGKSSLRKTGGGGISFFEDDFDNIIKRLESVRKQRELTAKQYLLNAEKFRIKEEETDKGKGPIGRTIDRIKADITEAEKDFNASVVGSPEKKRLEQKIINLRKELEAAGIPKTTTNDRGSRLTGAQKDAFKDIDATRDQQLAEERKKRLENTTTEEVFLNNILRINTEAINKKLAVIKGANAEERKQIAELNLEKITNEQETNKKLFDIRVEDRRAALEQSIRDANTAANVVANDPLATNTQIAQARLDADKKILEAQVKFANDLDLLEEKLSQQSLQNAKQSADEIFKTKQQLAEDEKKLLEARIEDIRINGEKEVSQINIDFAKVRTAILNNDRLTATQRSQQLDRLSKLQTFTVLTAELKRLTEEFKLIQKQYEEGLINEADYLKAKAALEEAYNKQQGANKDLDKKGNIVLPSSQSSQNLLREQLAKSFGFDEGSNEEQLFGFVLAQSFNLATEAMNSYFNAEEQRIRGSLDLQLERLDKEKEQVIARAQSQAEIDSIEKQYAQKKRQAEKEAGEQLKKTKKAEARITLASELANIAASAAGNVLNGVTLGAAGIAQYAILSAFAFGRYALRINEINNQQFEFGGNVPSRGGYIGGKPHSQGGTPFTFKGNSYEAEADEMSIIRTKDAPRNKLFQISGTQQQIASALNQIGGGVSFAKGASVKKFDFGGNLGESLQAPIFIPQMNTTLLTSSGISEEKFEQLVQKIETLAVEQSKRIDRLEVVQVTSTVTRAQKKEVQQSEIKTL